MTTADRDVGGAPSPSAGAHAPPFAAGPREASPPEPLVSPGLPALSRILGSVVAPTTLVTALLYYFGWMHAYFFFGYFGVNSTVLGFGTVDYLLRSVDALFIPVTTAAIIGLLALWGNASLIPRLHSRRNHRRNVLAVRGIAAGGAALAVTGAALTFATSSSSSGYAALAPVGFGTGVLVIAYAVHLHRILAARTRRPDAAPGAAASGWARATEWAIVFGLVGISLFTAATDYAAAVGQSRAQEFAASLPVQPEVALYSERSLSLSQPGVALSRCRDAQAAYQYRYDGLVLMLESGGKYVLVSRDWTPGGGAILLAESDTTRLEFYSSAAAPVPAGC